MDVTDVLRRLVRLRLAVAVVVVVALVAAGVAYLSADTSRQSKAAVVIVPPKVSGVAGGNNPLLSLDNNLAQLAIVLQGALGSASVSSALERAGATAEFSVSTVTGDNPSFSQLTPQLIFTVTGEDDGVTERTAAALLTQSGVALAALQNRAAVPASARATVVEVAAPTPPITVTSGRLRSAGTLGVGIVVLGLLLVLAVDAVRRRRNTDVTTTATTAPPSTSPPTKRPPAKTPAKTPAKKVAAKATSAGTTSANGASGKAASKSAQAGNRNGNRKAGGNGGGSRSSRPAQSRRSRG